MQCEWFKTYSFALSVRWVLDQFFLGQCAEEINIEWLYAGLSDHSRQTMQVCLYKGIFWQLIKRSRVTIILRVYNPYPSHLHKWGSLNIQMENALNLMLPVIPIWQSALPLKLHKITLLIIVRKWRILFHLSVSTDNVRRSLLFWLYIQLSEFHHLSILES